MKKIAFLFVAMMAMFSTVSAQNLTLEGSWVKLKEAGTYTMEVVYTDMKIEDQTVEEFLKTQDEKFNNAWATEIVPQSAQYATFIPYYANGKFTLDLANPQYKFVLKVNRLKLGFAGGAFIPFAGAKAGGANISGTMEFYDVKSGELLGTMTFENIQGVSAASDAQRWGMSYYDLGRRLKKALKKVK